MGMVLMILSCLSTPTAGMERPAETCKSGDGVFKYEQDNFSLGHYVGKKFTRASIWPGALLRHLGESKIDVASGTQVELPRAATRDYRAIWLTPLQCSSVVRRRLLERKPTGSLFVTMAGNSVSPEYTLIQDSVASRQTKLPETHWRPVPLCQCKHLVELSSLTEFSIPLNSIHKDASFLTTRPSITNTQLSYTFSTLICHPSQQG